MTTLRDVCALCTWHFTRVRRQNTTKKKKEKYKRRKKSGGRSSSCWVVLGRVFRPSPRSFFGWCCLPPSPFLGCASNHFLEVNEKMTCFVTESELIQCVFLAWAGCSCGHLRRAEGTIENIRNEQGGSGGERGRRREERKGEGRGGEEEFRKGKFKFRRVYA